MRTISERLRSTRPLPLRHARVIALGVIALLVPVVAVPTASAATLAEKQSQAAELNEQVLKLERTYDELQERLRGAKYELGEISEDAAAKRAELVRTRVQLRTARTRLSNRAVAIYQQGSGTTDVVQIAQAGSFSTFFERLETYSRVGAQDASIVADVEVLGRQVAKRERALRAAKAKQAEVVKDVAKHERAAKKNRDARQAKLDSVNAEIRAIMEAQRRAAEAAPARAARAEALAAKQAADAAPATDGGSESEAADVAGSSSPDAGAFSAVPLPPSSGSASAAASIAMGKIGTPYVWGGSGPDSFDCSGLVMWSFAQAGRPGLPHSSYSLAGMGVDVPLGQLQVGDLVFPSHNGHMGIYVGGGSFVHAPHSGDVVKVTSMSDYSISHARRI